MIAEGKKRQRRPHQDFPDIEEQDDVAAQDAVNQIVYGDEDLDDGGYPHPYCHTLQIFHIFGMCCLMCFSEIIEKEPRNDNGHDGRYVPDIYLHSIGIGADTDAHHHNGISRRYDQKQDIGQQR